MIFTSFSRNAYYLQQCPQRHQDKLVRLLGRVAIINRALAALVLDEDSDEEQNSDSLDDVSSFESDNDSEFDGDNMRDHNI